MTERLREISKKLSGLTLEGLPREIMETVQDAVNELDRIIFEGECHDPQTH